MAEKNIKYQSSRIFYRTIGKGDPVILIHGFGEDGDIWENQIAFLKDHFKLIIPDLPGSGRSEMIKDMSIEGMAELLKEIINIEVPFSSPLGVPEREGTQFGVGAVGHSMGGYITLALAEKYPGLLSSFALVHSSAFADSEEKKAVRLKSIEFIKKYGAYEFFKASIPNLFFRGQDGSEPSDPWINDLVEKSKDFLDKAIIQYYHSMINRPDRTNVLKNFSGHILFIIGEQDQAVPFQQSLQQCYLPGHSTIHILRNSAHMGMWEEPDQVNNALLQLK